MSTKKKKTSSQRAPKKVESGITALKAKSATSKLAKPRPGEFTARGIRKRKKRASRLSVEDWVNAAIEILVTRSIEHVRVERIAANLKATKGSFYWHFKNRAALLDAVIDQWRQIATTSVHNSIQSGGADAKEQLRRLLKFNPKDSRWFDLEVAMRAWARRSTRVRTVVSEVYNLRLEYVQQLFAELGFSGENKRARALIFYGTTRSLHATQRVEDTPDSFRERLLNLIISP